MLEQAANELELLRATLAADCTDFVLLSPLAESRAHARFIGHFENREVVWDMQLFTMARYEQERGSAPNTPLRGLMHIAPGTDCVYQLEVALNVPMIDEPTLKKAIVMMRNYKQLQLGLRTWGESILDTRSDPQHTFESR